MYRHSIVRHVTRLKDSALRLQALSPLKMAFETQLWLMAYLISTSKFKLLSKYRLDNNLSPITNQLPVLLLVHILPSFLLALHKNI